MRKTYKYFEDPLLETAAQNLETKLGTNQLSQEYLDFLQSSSHKSEHQVRQASKWLKNLLSITHLLIAKTATGSDVSIFWIRLEGVFNELNGYFARLLPKEHMDVLESLGKENIFIKTLHQQIRIARELQKMENLFTRDELLLIEYCRHYHAHVFQDKYELQLHGDTESLRVKTLRKGMDILTLKSIFAAELNKYQSDDSIAAQAFAQRIVLKLTEIVMLVGQWAPLS